MRSYIISIKGQEESEITNRLNEVRNRMGMTIHSNIDNKKKSGHGATLLQIFI